MYFNCTHQEDYNSSSNTDTYQTRISSIAACGTCCWACMLLLPPPLPLDVVVVRPMLSAMAFECACACRWWCEWPLLEGALLTPLLLLPFDGVWSMRLFKMAELPLTTTPPLLTPPPLPLPLPLPLVSAEEAVRIGGRGARICCCWALTPVMTLPFGWCLPPTCCCWYCCCCCWASARRGKWNTKYSERVRKVFLFVILNIEDSEINVPPATHAIVPSTFSYLWPCQPPHLCTHIHAHSADLRPACRHAGYLLLIVPTMYSHMYFCCCCTLIGMQIVCARLANRHIAPSATTQVRNLCNKNRGHSQANGNICSPWCIVIALVSGKCCTQRFTS